MSSITFAQQQSYVNKWKTSLEKEKTFNGLFVYYSTVFPVAYYKVIKMSQSYTYVFLDASTALVGNLFLAVYL